MAITTNIVGLNPTRSVLDATLCDKVCQWIVAGLWFSLGTPVSSTNKAVRHDIHVTEILLKVVLLTITLTPTQLSLLTSVARRYGLSINLPRKGGGVVEKEQA